MLCKIIDRKDARGFTLIELLAVIAIIGVLVALITPRVGENVEEAKNKACQANIKFLEGLLEQYKIVKGTYPKNFEELDAFYQGGEYPVCPHNKDTEDGKTGYFFNSNGQVFTEAGDGSVIEIINADQKAPAGG